MRGWTGGLGLSYKAGQNWVGKQLPSWVWAVPSYLSALSHCLYSLADHPFPLKPGGRELMDKEPSAVKGSVHASQFYMLSHLISKQSDQGRIITNKEDEVQNDSMDPKSLSRDLNPTF